MIYKPTALLIIILTIFCNAAVAQVDQSEMKHRRVRVGFFAGPVNYIGDYNPGLFGSDVAIDENTSIPTENFSGDLDFGFWTKVMLKEFLYIRGNAGFGTLAFHIDELDHNMNTSYKNFGLGLEASIFNQKKLRPYLTAGISTFSFTVPLVNDAEQFESFSVSEQGSNKSGMAIPIGLGVDYKLSRLTTIFFETTLTLTDRDDLDNIALPSNRTDAPFTNDAFVSYRFGIGFSAIEFFKLAFTSKEVKETKPVTLFSPVYDDTLVYDRIQPRNLITQDTIEADKRRVFPEFYDYDQPDVTQNAEDVAEADNQTRTRQQDKDEPPPRDTDTNKDDVIESNVDESINTDAYVKSKMQKIEQLRNRALKLTQQEDPVDVKEAFQNVPQITREPFIVYQQPDSMVVTDDPPPGYYILAYTSVGPETTLRAKETVFNILKNRLPAAEQQVFITRREEFFEVRVGIFKNYENARKVVDLVRGTFFDAYIMFYAKD